MFLNLSRSPTQYQWYTRIYIFIRVYGCTYADAVNSWPSVVSSKLLLIFFFFFCVVSCVQFIPPSVLHFNRPRRLFHIFLFIHWWRCNGNESAAANVQSPKWWCDVGQTEGKLICDKLGTFFHVCPVRSIRWCGQHLATAAFAYVCTYNGGYMRCA